MYHHSVARSELKYIISTTEYVYLKTLLTAVMEPDPHSNSEGHYYIRSVYFDAYSNKDYYEKEAGLYKRKKIRLRLYDSSDEQIKLEVKNKEGSYSLKETGVISRDDASALMAGDYESLLSYDQPATRSVYNHFRTDYYMPAVVIDYEREAYINEALNIRINFDKCIRASSANAQLFDTTSVLTKIIEDDQYVLEVKYGHVLPDFYRDILSSAKLQKESYSKYGRSREMV